jgi:hypothetical protein
MVSVVINYCSNEKAFIKALLTECGRFSDDIVVSYGSHLYDGTREDKEHIDSCKLAFPNVVFVEYTVDKAMNLYEQRGVKNRPTAYWHNLARWTGLRALKKHEWVFIIDADEIPEGRLVSAWLEKAWLLLKEEECYKIANFWYFKDPTNQSTTLEDSVLLIHYKHCTEDNIFGDNERDHLIPSSGCKLVRQVRGLGGAVLFHHYSFVRSRSQLEHKMKNWAHANDLFKDANVNAIVDEIYKDDEKVRDIVHGYSYVKVYNKFGIKLE